MGTLTIKFVKPDMVLYEGQASSVVLATYTGELGVLPGHASEICALGDGVVRIRATEENGGEVNRVMVSGGYAEIHNDTVVIIADHARAVSDFDEAIVRERREEAVAARDVLAEDDPARAYYDNKISWFDFEMKHAGSGAGM